MATKLIVFDWDGTLMDSAARIVNCMHAAVADVGLPTRQDAQIRNIIGLGLRESVSTLFPGLSEADYAALVARYRVHYLELNQTPSELFDGTAELIDALLELGFFLAVATGKGRQGLERVLQETGLKSAFHATRCADEAFSKPHPQMLLELMDELGQDPSETLMVGDTEYDIQMAHNAGAQALAVSYGAHDKQRLLDLNPLACVDDMGQLSQCLLDIPGIRNAS